MAQRRFTPQPVTQIGTWESARIVDAIIDEMEMGQFFNASLLVDQVLRDDRIRGVLTARIYGLLGRDFKLEPATGIKGGEGRGRKIAEEIEYYWPEMFPHDALVELMTWGLLLGVGLAQVVTNRVRGESVTTIEVWHPQALRYDDERGVYLLQPKGMSEVEIEPGDGQWLLFTPYGRRNPGRRGLLRSLGSMYLDRRGERRDRARYSEIHGQPMRVGMSPVGATQEAVEAFARDLSPVGAEPVVVVRQGEDGNKWDVKLVEASGKSQELFEQAIDELDTAIAVLILGQALSTDGQAGLGSNAEAGELVRIDIMRQDNDSLGSTLRDQVLMPYCEFTYGAADLAPYPCWEVDPPEDMTEKAQELSTLADALSKFSTMSAPVDVRAVLEAHKVPMLSEAEAAKLEADKQKKALEVAQSQPPVSTNGAPNGEKEQPPASA
jgi:phage gp29-like protein